MQFIELSVGKKICEPTFQDGPKLELTENGLVLLIQFQWPAAEEIHAIRDCDALFRAVVVDGVLFFLAKFGKMPWMDAPFHRALANTPDAERPSAGYGLALHILLVDSCTGVLKAQRIIGLKNSFSNEFIDLLEKQEGDVPKDWEQMVRSTYAKYSPSQLAELAKLRNFHATGK